jgi:hypothetical protein
VHIFQLKNTLLIHRLLKIMALSLKMSPPELRKNAKSTAFCCHAFHSCVSVMPHVQAYVHAQLSI